VYCRRELEGRNKQNLDKQFVVEAIDWHNSDDFKMKAKRHKLYPFCLVMPRGDRTLLDVLHHENLAPSPDEVHWAEVNNIAKELLEAIRHLNGKRLMHGDLKP
jgi:hypothetical protein